MAQIKSLNRKYTETFDEVYDDGYKQIFIRKFGHVFPNDNKKVELLVIAEIYDLDGSGAVNPKELNDITKPVMLTFSILPELKNVAKTTRDSIAKSSGCGEDFKATLVDVYEYMGGCRFEPSDIVWFETNEKALEHLMSKPLNDQISGQGMLSGFVMDQHYNRRGETNWTILEKIMKGR